MESSINIPLVSYVIVHLPCSAEKSCSRECVVVACDGRAGRSNITARATAWTTPRVSVVATTPENNIFNFYFVLNSSHLLLQVLKQFPLPGSGELFLDQAELCTPP